MIRLTVDEAIASKVLAGCAWFTGVNASAVNPFWEEMDDLGLSLAPADEYDGAGDVGVVITDVDPDSKAAEKGLKAGDVILEVGGDPVSRPRDVAERIRQAKDKGRKAVLMRIQSGERQRFIGLPVGKV